MQRDCEGNFGIGSWNEIISIKARAAKLEGGRKGQTSHFVHGLCGKTSRR
jgi:hypothetical protein